MDEDWKLTPAYDLTPSIVVSLERRDLAMICGDRGRYAQAENLLSQCERLWLPGEPTESGALICSMRSRREYGGDLR